MLLRTPEELELKLKEEAKECEMPVSALIRRIVKQYFKEKKNDI